MEIVPRRKQLATFNEGAVMEYHQFLDVLIATALRQSHRSRA
jgi:hypothetical protein